MANFYVTFGQREPVLKYGWVRITNTESPTVATDIATDITDGAYSMLYVEDRFPESVRRWFPYGEFLVVDAKHVLKTMDIHHLRQVAEEVANSRQDTEE